MGMEQTVRYRTTPPVWLAARDLLAARDFALQMRMIDGQLAFPADQPPESEWHRTGSTFTNQTYGHKGGYGLASVTVYQGASNLRNLEGGTTPRDQWSVDGGCV